MYKRPPSKNAFQYKEPKPKMRKLNVSLSSAGASNQSDNAEPTNTMQLSKPSTSKNVNNDEQNAASSSAHSNNQRDVAHQIQTANVPAPNDENLWADADDECILIASQMVDNMDMDAINQQIIVQSMNLSQNNVVETKPINEAQNILNDFFQSSEEDNRIFSEINNFDNIGNQDMTERITSTQCNPATQRPKSPLVFKVPTQFRHDKRTIPAPIQSSTQRDMNISFRPEGLPQSTQFSQQIEIPKPFGNLLEMSLRLVEFNCFFSQSEAQTEGQNLKVKFLTQKQGDLQKEIEHLGCENQRLTELCQTKDGEV